MTVVHLPTSLRNLIGGRQEVDIAAGDVRSLVTELESRYPDLAGRVRDEQGALRPHVKIFINGEVVGLEDPVGESDEVRILPAISGGADETELLVGTRKGLIVLRGRRCPSARPLHMSPQLRVVPEGEMAMSRRLSFAGLGLPVFGFCAGALRPCSSTTVMLTRKQSTWVSVSAPNFSGTRVATGSR